MNKLKPVIITLVLILLLGGTYILYNKLTEGNTANQLVTYEPDTTPNAPTPRNPAPDFTVYDKSGNKVKLSDFAGKPTVVNFWASWCGPCKREMPDFQEKYSELGSDINFLMINMTDGSRETVEDAHNFISEQEYTFPVYYDNDADAAIKYNVSSIPATYFIDKDGNLIAGVNGAINGATLQKCIDMIKEK